MALPHLYEKNGSWHVRLPRQKDGARPSKRLGSTAEYPREADIAPIYYQWMSDQTNQKPEPVSQIKTLRDFVVHPNGFFRYIEVKRKASTVTGYKQMWNKYLDAELGGMKLTDFRQADARLVLEKLQKKGFGHNLVQNAKIVLSSICKRAIALNLLKDNPIHGLELEDDRAQGKPKAELDGPRYTKDEVDRAMAVLSGRDEALVATIFFAALRPGEVAALKWEDYDGHTLLIDRAVWHGKIDTPKTQSSQSRVPVIGPLRPVLDAYKKTTAGVSWMFPGATGNPVVLAALARRTLKAAFEKAGVEWRGWYAFRRGATDYLLLTMGLEFDEVRAILRHDPTSRVLEKHYAAEASRRGVQQRIVVAIGKKIDAAWQKEEARKTANVVVN
jgi:integrase